MSFITMIGSKWDLSVVKRRLSEKIQAKVRPSGSSLLRPWKIVVSGLVWPFALGRTIVFIPVLSFAPWRMGIHRGIL